MGNPKQKLPLRICIFCECFPGTDIFFYFRKQTIERKYFEISPPFKNKKLRSFATFNETGRAFPALLNPGRKIVFRWGKSNGTLFHLAHISRSGNTFQNSSRKSWRTAWWSRSKRCKTAFLGILTKLLKLFPIQFNCPSMKIAYPLKLETRSPLDWFVNYII